MIRNLTDRDTEQLSQEGKNRRFNAIARVALRKIVHGKRSITPTMSIRFGAFFGQSDDFWHGLQVECDFRTLAKDRKSSPQNSV